MIPKLKLIKEILFDEKKCIEFLFENNILNKIQKCQYCESSIYKEKKLFRCNNIKCRKTISIFKNTFFSKHHLACNDTILIGYFWLSKANYTTISSITKFSPNTIVKYLKTFQKLIINTLTSDDYLLGGKHVIVEIDESKFKKDTNSWVVGFVERSKAKKCFFVLVEDRCNQTLKNIIKKHVRIGSTIYTDSWRGYQGLEELGYRHVRVNHSKENLRQKIRKIHTLTIEGTWRGIKMNLNERNRNRNVINDHLMEFVWRRKHRDNLWQSFLEALKKNIQ
jgi:transposase-like protein